MDHISLFEYDSIVAAFDSLAMMRGEDDAIVYQTKLDDDIVESTEDDAVVYQTNLDDDILESTEDV